MLSHAELVALVERFLAGAEGDDAELLLDRLREQLPHPDLAQLIYWPDQVPDFPFTEPTAEQVVAFAAAYCPRPLPVADLAHLLGRWIERAERAEPSPEEVYRLMDTIPKFDWTTAVNWARFRNWSGLELASRILAGDLERDPDYQRWLADVFEAEVE